MIQRTAERPSCGTLAAYRYHKKQLKEDPCEACVRNMVAAVAGRHNIGAAGSVHDGYYLARIKEELFARYGVTES